MQLGAVRDQLGRQFLPSVGWRTGQSGAPPDMNSTILVRDLFLFWRSRPLDLRIRWRTGHCPVRLSDRWLGHVSPVDRVDDRWPWAPLAYRTVRWILAATPSPFSQEWRVRRRRLGHGRWWLIGQFDAPLNSPMIFSHVASPIPDSNYFAAGPAWAPDTVRCARLVLLLLITTTSSSIFFLFSWTCL
jgi:hypothetical protein